MGNNMNSTSTNNNFEQALEKLNQCDTTVLTFIENSEQNNLPISIVRIENDLYFFSSKIDRNLFSRNLNKEISITLIGTQKENDCNIAKLIIDGNISVVNNLAEKNYVIERICEKFYPSSVGDLNQYIISKQTISTIYKISIKYLSIV